MAYFSRLTDIVTCNLSSLLAAADDPERALDAILREMREGLAGAERCVRQAVGNVVRLEAEIGEQRKEADCWLTRAREALENSDEVQARCALARKHEVEDLIAGLEQQLEAAINARDHLQTMLNALQARLADACRRLADIKAGRDPQAALVEASESDQPLSPSPQQTRVDAELAELRRQLSGG